MKEGISPLFPREHFVRPQLTRGFFAKVSSLWASSSLFRVTGRERTRSHLLSRAAPASLLTVSLRELARRLDSIRQEQLLFSLTPDFLWSKDVLI